MQHGAKTMFKILTILALMVSPAVAKTQHVWTDPQIGPYWQDYSRIAKNNNDLDFYVFKNEFIEVQNAHATSNSRWTPLSIATKSTSWVGAMLHRGSMLDR